MTESNAPPKSFKIVHGVALAFLFLMMAQPTFGNLRSLFTGSIVMGDLHIEVTLSKLALHLLATVVGWVGFWWFLKRRKRGAYVSIAAHLLGLVATITQTPEMMKAFPPAMLAVFFVVLFAVALGPIVVFKDQYS